MCKKHREEIIEVCVQPGCANVLCHKCKTTTHKGHDTLVLSDHKEKCLSELKDFSKWLGSYSTHLKEILQDKDTLMGKQEEMVPYKKIKMAVGSPGSNVTGNDASEKVQREDRLFQSLLQQNSRVKEASECIEKALDPFLLDQLSSLPFIQEAYDSVLEVYKEDHLLPEQVTDILQLPHSIVRADCGISMAVRMNAFCLCRNEDIAVAGEDIVDQIWRIRRFTRLGRLAWNRPLPLSWSSVDAMAEFHGENEDSLLLSNANEGKIVMMKHNGSTLCYMDKKKSPQAMCLSPDCRLLFFEDGSQDYDGGLIVLLDTTTLPFLPVRNISLGLNFPFEMTYLEEDTDTLVITSNVKRLIKAIRVTDGNPVWSLGPVIAGREIHPHGVCCSPKGDIH